ncbi:nicotinamide-nucleotide amidase [Verrucomicrobium sp. GAS474]|uniref:competence/damage-inducible protein A n=1 Tax=Verrucomicrobium sp. GAS474 TaxID=1882831 RepID=UPI00087AEDB7|nr:competence/damage-inducible protein A [Verrucomicrobium sp. GAS474]SDU30667.1 nicotinamide-nucleotide amidase [Verrucomicrobium sp. GAS474]
MNVEILNTGSELLLGHVVNTHAAFLGREAFPLGLRISRQTTVPDGAAIGTALAEALGRSDLILVTGGLGPTSDDITRELTAELLGLPLASDPAVLAHIKGYIESRGSAMAPINARQAMVPAGAVVLHNPVGTAPGLILEKEGKIIVLLPGPPRELIPMWRDGFVPWFRRRGLLPPLHMRSWNIVDVPESRLATIIEEPLRALPGGETLEIGYCARPGQVDLRLIAPAPAVLEAAALLVAEKLGPNIATVDGETLEACVVRLLTERKQTVATAESCTGGLIAHRLTNVPGASRVLRYGWVVYANEAKVEELDVPTPLFAEDGPGAVSEETARAMAVGARLRARADFAVAVTGIAGPDGGTPEKPVGTVWIAIASDAGTEAVLKTIKAERETFKNRVAQTALDLLRRAVHTSV